tara:strand:- start:1847 stop:2026 length:180 start_codon:yes stop_codon:yes gene_type:complete
MLQALGLAYEFRNFKAPRKLAEAKNSSENGRFAKSHRKETQKSFIADKYGKHHKLNLLI